MTHVVKKFTRNRVSQSIIIFVQQFKNSVFPFTYFRFEILFLTIYTALLPI